MPDGVFKDNLFLTYIQIKNFVANYSDSGKELPKVDKVLLENLGTEIDGLLKTPLNDLGSQQIDEIRGRIDYNAVMSVFGNYTDLSKHGKLKTALFQLLSLDSETNVVAEMNKLPKSLEELLQQSMSNLRTKEDVEKNDKELVGILDTRHKFRLDDEYVVFSFSPNQTSIVTDQNAANLVMNVFDEKRIPDYQRLLAYELQARGVQVEDKGYRADPDAGTDQNYAIILKFDKGDKDKILPAIESIKTLAGVEEAERPYIQKLEALLMKAPEMEQELGALVLHLREQGSQLTLAADGKFSDQKTADLVAKLKEKAKESNVDVDLSLKR